MSLAAQDPPHPPAGNLAVDNPVAPDVFPADQMTKVLDFSKTIRPEERDAYYGLLKHVSTVSQASQNSAAKGTMESAKKRLEDWNATQKRKRKFSLFAEIVRDPEAFRGQPIRLRGHVQQLRSYDAGENDFGFRELHEAWLFTDDSLGNPYVVVALEKSAGMPEPTRGSPITDVFVTGCFFKIWSYEAGDGKTWGAPLIIANRIEWRPREPDPNAALKRWGFVALLAAAALGLVFVVWRQMHSPRDPRLRPTAAPPPTDFVPD